MLDPASHRIDFGHMLRPPSAEGPGDHAYKLDAAIATTYSLDLNALLTLPVSLIMGETMEGDIADDSVALVEAIRQLRGKLRVFYQAGNIHLPLRFSKLYSLLEPLLVPIVPAGHIHSQSRGLSSFHPKVWLLRYVRASCKQPGLSDPERRYRLLVMSRNITFDRSWDITACLDGVPTGHQVHCKQSHAQKSSNNQLVRFIASLLPSVVNQASRNETHVASCPPLDSMVDDLKHISWRVPPPFDTLRFLPGGGAHIAHADQRFGSPLDVQGQYDELLVVSPFASSNALKRLAKHATGRRILISRRETLDALAQRDASFQSTWECYRLNDQIVDGEELAGVTNPRRQDVHAKLFVFCRPDKACWYLGSANATTAALGGTAFSPRNTEFMLKLSGCGESLGMDALMTAWTQHNADSFIVKHEFNTQDIPDDTQDEHTLHHIAQALIETKWTWQICADSTGSKYTVELNADAGLPDIPEGWTIHVHLLSRLDSTSDNWDELTSLPKQWENVSLTELSAFVPIRIRNHNGTQEKQLLIKCDLPTSLDRETAILRELIDSPERFIRYVQMMLDTTSDKRRVLRQQDLGVGNLQAAVSNAVANQPLFELMMLAASRQRDQLARLASRIDQLIEHSDSPADFVPTGFMELWQHFRPRNADKK